MQQQQQQAFANHHHQLSSNSSSAFSSPPQQLLPPPQQQQQQQKTSQATFGFEDDFSSLSNSLSSDAVSNQQKQAQLTNPTLSLSTTTANNTSAAEQLRKSHRRSASHSSTIFSSNIQPQTLITPQGVTSQQPAQNMQYTAAVPPLPPHQYVLQPASQPIATLQQQQPQPVASTIMSGITPPSLRYINHSRSASASPKYIDLFISHLICY